MIYRGGSIQPEKSPNINNNNNVVASAVRHLFVFSELACPTGVVRLVCFSFILGPGGPTGRPAWGRTQDDNTIMVGFRLTENGIKRMRSHGKL